MRRPTIALVLALLVVAGLTVPAAPPARAAVPTDPKVVVVVGATHSATSKYRSYADAVVAEARKYTPDVVKVYSPNATWSAVRSAMQGASIVVYLGHGNGFPSPYRSTMWPYSQNGFGLNAAAGQGDSNTQYWGEHYIANEVRLAPNAVVLLNHLCYASGNSEPGHAEPSLSVAHQRIDNYAAGFLKAGARAVVAEGHADVVGWVRLLFTTRQRIEDAFDGYHAANGNTVSWPSSRSPGYTAFSDPDSPTKGFYRSFVGRPDLETSDVTGAAFADSGADPDDFVVPGAASVGADGAIALPEPPVPATADAFETLAVDGTPIPADTALRVVGEAEPLETGERVLEVETLEGDPLGWVVGTALVPRDSLPPTVWGLPDRLTVTPNGDGTDDRLAIDGSFSEPVEWRFRVRNTAGTVVHEATGNGDALVVDWDVTSGGKAVADGEYTYSLGAADEWGNAPLARTGLILVDRRPDARIGGADRYATAAAISKATFPVGVPVAYVATGANFPDALAGAAAAGKSGGPVLLTTPDALPAATATELGRLKPGRIVVLGSTAVVSDAVKAALAAYTDGTVTRIGGADRYATAAKISKATFPTGVEVAYVATGANFPDALAGAAAAAKTGGPVLLVEADTIPAPIAAELTRLAPGRIVVLGSTAVVSASVMAALDAYTDGSVTRLGGADRYATAAAISKATFGPGVPTSYVATGANFPDALAGAAAAGRTGGPVLLVGQWSVPAPTATELGRLDPARVFVLGSTAVIDDTVKYAVRAYETP
jgi:putative cell wall-binding protein